MSEPETLLEGACLSGLDLSGVVFTATDLDRVEAIGTDFNGAVFKDSGSYFSTNRTLMLRGNFSGANFSGSEFSGDYIALDGSFSEANFSEVSFQPDRSLNVSGTWTGATLANVSAQTVWDIDMTSVDLSSADLSGMNLEAGWGIDMRGANFANANLSDASLQSDWTIDIRSAEFSGANLNNMSFDVGSWYFRGQGSLCAGNQVSTVNFVGEAAGYTLGCG